MAAGRFEALDIFRGYTVAAMILVNTPGSWAHIHAPLRHAYWHGWTPTDLVFPFFLFIVGAAMCFSLPKTAAAPGPAQLGKILRRAAVIFLLGLLLNAFPFQEPLAQLRIMGVLQRIALVYLLAALLLMYFDQTARAIVVVILLLGYWWLLSGGGYTPASNVVRSVDLALLGESHMWRLGDTAFEPEGLLSTLPATASALAGYEITRLLVARPGMYSRMVLLLSLGAALTAAGLIWDRWLPINKSLWTPSFVLLSTGMAAWGLAACVCLAGFKATARPAFIGRVYGLNPLFIYVLSWLWVESCIAFIKVGDGAGATIDGYTALYRWFLSGLSPVNASLAFALLHVALFWLLAWVLYRRNVLIKL